MELWAAHDVGRALNPIQVEGQIQGGALQGLGLAFVITSYSIHYTKLYEEQAHHQHAQVGLRERGAQRVALERGTRNNFV